MKNETILKLLKPKILKKPTILNYLIPQKNEISNFEDNFNLKHIKLTPSSYFIEEHTANKAETIFILSLYSEQKRILLISATGNSTFQNLYDILRKQLLIPNSERAIFLQPNKTKPLKKFSPILMNRHLADNLNGILYFYLQTETKDYLLDIDNILLAEKTTGSISFRNIVLFSCALCKNNQASVILGPNPLLSKKNNRICEDCFKTVFIKDKELLNTIQYEKFYD